MTIPSNNISLDEISSEVLDPTSSNVSLNSIFKRFLIGNTTLNSQIQMSSFANLTASVGWISTAVGNTNSNTAILKTVRPTTNTYANYAQQSSVLVLGNTYSAMTNDGTYLAIWDNLSTTTVRLYSRSGGTWTLQSSLLLSGTYTGTQNCGAWDSTGTYLALSYGPDVTGTTAVFAAVLKRTGNTLSQLSVPTTSTFPTTGAMFPLWVAWSPDGATLSVWSDTPSTSQNALMRYSRSGDTLTALSLLATGNVPASGSQFFGFGYNPDGSKAICSWFGTAIRTFTYTISGTTWGRSDPGSTVAAEAINITWDPAGLTVFGQNSSGATQIWTVSGTTYTRLSALAGSSFYGAYCDTAYYAANGSTIRQVQGSGSSWTLSNNLNGSLDTNQSVWSASKKSVPGSP